MLRPAPIRRAAPLTRPAALAALFGVLATVLSAIGSGIPSLWGDEATSIMSAQRPLPTLFAMLGRLDAVHGAYYLGLHFWGELFGFSPVSVRLPSAIAVGLATAAVVLLAARLRDVRTAVVAGLVCAILPRVAYMGEEARSFAFSAAIVAWLTVLLIAALDRDRPRAAWFAGYGALLAVGTYVFLYTALFAIVHGVIVAVSRAPRRTIRGWLIAVGAAILATAPLLIVAIGQHHQIAYLGAVQQLAPQTLFSGLWFGDSWPLAIAAWALIGVAVVTEARRRALVARAAGGGLFFGSGTRLPSLVPLALLWLVLPPAILIAVQSVVPDFTARYVSFCAPAAALLIACGVDDLMRWRRWAGVVAGVLVLALCVPVYVAERTPYAKNQSDWAEVSAAIGANAHAGDGVVFDESTKPSKLPRLAEHTYPAGFAGTKDIALDLPFAQTTSWRDSVYTVRQAAALGRFDGVGRVWLIEYAASPGSVDDYGVADLAALGFHETSTRIATHRELISLYERTP
ncbi:glycosyltransferase family 39 protein [Leifsonia shinshuensis]|uniref:Mannosyltransferase n=1 Tax=Leifsonia shinshuensis TaxID=150026 RepID=A0A853CZR8_9MICO|nr:glycosyltransferase family 39 protein [Leifsonia shinshuensis]NYJ24801.1 mannosyltransferase [Leifsonia shinshuensis]